MKQELDKIIQKLQTDPMFAISVENIDQSGNKFRIITNATNEMLIAKYGSSANFFESLFKSGVQKIAITPRKQNGTKAGKINYKLAGASFPAFEMEFEPKQNTEIKAYDQHSNYQVPAPQLNGANGLTGADLHKVYDYQRIQQENSDLKAENKQLLAKNESLKEENLRAELLGVKSVEKTESNAKLIASASPFIPILQALLMGAKNGNPEVPGLGQGISTIKQWFLQQDDELLQDLSLVAKGLEVPQFESQLKELLIANNLIQNDV